jgi:hypothetical protein
MEKFWMVWRVGGPGPTVQHTTLYDAEKEAERLALNNPSVKFVILESLKYCEAKTPVTWHDVREQLPF